MIKFGNSVKESLLGSQCNVLALVGAAACGIVRAFRETFEVCMPSCEARVIVSEAVWLYGE